MPQRETRAGDVDRVFDALSHPCRRRVLVHASDLVPGDGASLALEDVLTDVDDPERHSIALYHVHLPKLHGWGFIEWDRDSHEIRRGPRFDEVGQLLEAVGDPQEGNHRERPPDSGPDR